MMRAKKVSSQEIQGMLDRGELAHHVTVDPHPRPRNVWELHYSMRWWFGGVSEFFVYYAH